MNRQQGTLVALFIALVVIGLSTMGFIVGGVALTWEKQRQPLLLMPPPSLSEQLTDTRRELRQALTLLSACFGSPVKPGHFRTTPVTITAYSSTEDQTDSTPHITASNAPVRVGIVAVSPDLRTRFGISFGQRVLLPGYGVFEVHDLMNPRWRSRVDIWESDREAARRFGYQKGVLIWATEEDGADETSPSATTESILEGLQVAEASARF